jgi:thiamine biosynthesis lipoprotein
MAGNYNVVKDSMEVFDMGRKIPQILLLVLILSAVVLFFRLTVEPPRPVQADGGYRQVMGTIAHIVAVAPDEKRANISIESAFTMLAVVEKLMSDYDPASQLSVVNEGAYESQVKVSGPLFEVLAAAVEYSKKTDGAFDVTIGPVVDAWRKAAGEERKPTDEELAAAKERVGYEKLLLDAENRTVKFAVEGMRLDLGGIAKGYAIDRAVKSMRASGAVGGMVDVGGDIRCFGKRKDNAQQWLVGLQNPEVEGDLLLKLRLNDTAVATSGDYRRFVLIDGQRYSHIFDPARSTSAQNLTSVTIIAPTAMQADILATAVSVMGEEKGLKLIESTPNTEAIIIPTDPEKNIIKTSGSEYYIHVE